MTNIYNNLMEEYPFLTLLKYGNNEYLGIMQNVDTQIASMYVYDRIKDIQEKQLFLELGEEWWWETNRKLPINITLRHRWPFAYTCQSFNVKQMEIIAGPEVKLSDSITRRIKRRSISIVKKS